MRFKASIKNISVFTKLVASLSSLHKVAWIRLDDDHVRFTIIPEQGTQVWAVLSISTIFSAYTLQSAIPSNAINLEVPLIPLLRALRSAHSATSATIRLTKKADIPLLSLTIQTSTQLLPPNRPFNATSYASDDDPSNNNISIHPIPDRETTIIQDIPVRVLAASSVASIHEPRCPDPDVHIILPPLHLLKSISERFTKIALSASSSSTSSTTPPPRLTLSATMHGSFRLSLNTDNLRIESTWHHLQNPELDPSQIEGGEEGIRKHASTIMKEREGEEAWAVVRVEGRDWGRVLGVGRMGGKVIACVCHETALVLYVYLVDEETADEGSVLTSRQYYITSYSA